MSDFAAAVDALIGNPYDVINQIADEDGNFTYEDFLYTVIQANQRAYIEFLYLCRDHERPFNSAHRQIGAALNKLISDEYSNNNVEGTTFDIFHNPTKNYVYKKRL